MSVVRFGVSLEKSLLEDLDEYVKKNSFSNRSQAIRKLISSTKVKEKWDENKIVAGSITIVYDHHKKDVLNKLTDVSHDYHDVILSSQHFHLNHDSCLEIIVVKGKSKLLKELSDKIIALKGIAHGKLTMTDA